jgi:hypothetical protein
MRLFFKRVAKPPKRLIHARNRSPHPMRMRERVPQLGQCDVRILADQLDQKVIIKRFEFLLIL